MDLSEYEPDDRLLRLTRTSPSGVVKIFSITKRRPIGRWNLTGFNGDPKNKTLGVMIRGDGEPPVVAKSGWASSLDQYKEDNSWSPIKGSTYTGKAWKLCEALGCPLVTHPKLDRGTPGYFEASRAEMHLMAWFAEQYFPRLYGGRRPRANTVFSNTEVLIISNCNPYDSSYRLAECIRRETGINIRMENRRGVLYRD